MKVYILPADTSGCGHIVLGHQIVLIDSADMDLVRGFEWRVLGNGYVMAQRGHMEIYLHRLIAGASAGELVDHINRDPLDNRSANLRIATKSQNGANRGPDRRRLGTSSRHKGVAWRKNRNCWGAYIHVEGKTRYLGSFKNEDEAAVAYNMAALKTWGKFARLNDVPTPSGGDAK